MNSPAHSGNEVQTATYSAAGAIARPSFRKKPRVVWRGSPHALGSSELEIDELTLSPRAEQQKRHRRRVIHRPAEAARKGQDRPLNVASPLDSEIDQQHGDDADDAKDEVLARAD